MDEINLLVVEDEAITAMDIQQKLQDLGYKVPATLSTGEEAILMAEKLRPNLILMDIVLAGEIDGTVAAQRISELYHIPIIFLTAYSDASALTRAKESLPYGYITKPFKLDELRIAVELALYKSKMEAESEIKTTRLKNEFLNNMTHVIRIPLNGIICSVELLSKGTLRPISAEHKEILDYILQGLKFLLQVLSNILEFTRAQSKEIQFYPKLTNLNTLVRKVCSANQVDIAKTKHKLFIKIDPTLTDVVIDSEKLEEVLQQYLSNAIKFSPENTSIEIDVLSENEDLFRIAVKDNGVGIRPEDVNNLFVPFRQLNTRTKKEFQGTGLGLALVKNIVEAQNGKVDVESTVGKGSTFYAIYRRDNSNQHVMKDVSNSIPAAQ